jgi:hypothetical protein
MHKLIVILVLFLVVAGCSKDDAIYQEVNTTYTAANPVDTTLKVVVFPNPFDSLISINFTLTNTENAAIEILDNFGRIVYNLPFVSVKSGDNQIMLDLSQLSSGIYVLKLKSGNRSIIKKILKA